MRFKFSPRRRTPPPSVVPSAVDQVPVKREYHFILVGGAGVGKMALALQFVQEYFVEAYDPTVDEVFRKQCVIDDEVAFLDIVVATHQDEGLVRPYIREGEDFLLVYSITSRDSFEEISIFHQQILRVKNQEPSRIILVANKCDLEHQRQVSIDEGRDLAKDLGCNFIETSAKLRTNVDEAFSNLVRDIRRFNKEQASAGSTVAGGVGASGSQKNDDAGCTCVVL